MGTNDRFVVKHPKGWAVKAGGADRASSLHPTQKAAEQAAKQIVRKNGGGEVRIQGGKWAVAGFRYCFPRPGSPSAQGQETLALSLTSA